MTTIDDDKDSLYKTLLESTKAIPWKLNWTTKQFEYIGPQIEKLLGWTQDSWATAQDWIDRIHPEDREKTANLCISQSEYGVDHEADYRALTTDGGYVWVRDVVHVLRENGVTTSLVGFIFDISERKKLEDVLLRLNKQLEALSFHDALTGVANRRMFDRTMEVEWGRAQRNAEPMSVILIDIDHFKQYNDHYGHVAGDECLMTVAQALDAVSLRSTDLFARYGGEEFVLMLPNTDREAALEIAERCRTAVLDVQIPHAVSEVADVVTISAGLSTVVPSVSTHPSSIIEAADKMLYQAKQQGRNRVEYAGPRKAKVQT
ncbi:MAG: sensor domain-containing diguanylate cyclase [Chromatiales bacterium]|jgi:diguanylate cyclase (GGDEF)-like protein/PAS domain S-box-containing protein|nr:sensor domain-containing diguanylate cyclase [Chromatiales bacterium]MDX9768305.1 sensor domain-containing diguanylate cyclase [Ectothiorhodospiraceae bacterium]